VSPLLRITRTALVPFLLILTSGISRAEEETPSGGDAAPDTTVSVAEDEGGGAPADSASAPAAPDSAVTRKFLSTDGSVRVYEEAVPGEGIEGFWWEYDSQADLARLLDKERRDQPLDPLTDAFGFQITMPESIRTLRDSVTAVADSIRAQTIEITSSFNPKLKTTYTEQKDVYRLQNELDTSIPFIGGGTVITRVTDGNEFNESTRKVKDDRTLSSTFNFRYREGTTASFTLSRDDREQKRDTTLESKSGNTALTGQVRFKQDVPVVGSLESSVGLTFSRNSYETRLTDGKTDQLSPKWGIKVSRPVGGNKFGIDYSGNLSRGDREEVRTFDTVDSLGQPVTVKDTTSTTDENLRNKVTASLDAEFDADTKLKLTSGYTVNRQQYISQVDSLSGRQETRTTSEQNVRANLTSKPIEALEVRANAQVRRSERDFDLETVRFSRTLTRSADLDMNYKPWEGARFTVKMERRHEDQDYRTRQAGTVETQKGQIDYRQSILQNVEFQGGYFISLDVHAFDDKEANDNDRDLRTQRGTFTVRYNPWTTFGGSLKMEVRQQESINIDPRKSPDNKTDYTYLITPSYNLRIGKANINGEFTADAKYAVFDFQEDRNNLRRRFSTRQRWQHAFTTRLSTELLGSYEFSDEGAYRKNEFDGRRLFIRSREVRRFNVEARVLYNPLSGIRTQVTYRRYGDDQYVVDEGERTLTSEPRTQEISTGVQLKKSIVKHIRLDLNFSQTQKSGDRVSDFEKRFYTIRAGIEYQPFKRGD
jgi:hypothetical protein